MCLHERNERETEMGNVYLYPQGLPNLEEFEPKLNQL